MQAGGPRTQAPARGRVWEGNALPGNPCVSHRGAACPYARLMRPHQPDW